MPLPKQDIAALSTTWTEGVLLKRDVFSTVERGRFRTNGTEVDAVLRRLDQVPWWSYLVARHLFERERKALARARDLNVGPKLLWGGRSALVRGFIDGVALHLAKPYGDRDYFLSAKRALHRLHRAGICHNDLAKEQNWLRGSDGRAYVTDFQLAACFNRRSRLFRIAAYEDLRHLLKHKRTYAPDLLTPCERKILARKSLVALTWLMTGKKVYLVTAAGGVFSEGDWAPFDFQTGYLRHLLGFIGLTDIEIVRVEGTVFGPEAAKAAIAATEAQVRSVLEKAA